MNVRLGIRNRLLLLMGIMLVFLGTVVAFFVYQASDTKEKMIERVGLIMTEDAKDKIMVLTKSVSASVAAGQRGLKSLPSRMSGGAMTQASVRYWQ
jgi:methyl-accepting chemotaxis protein